MAELESLAQQAWLNRRQGLAVILRRDEAQGALCVEDAREPDEEAGLDRPGGAALNSVLARTGGNKARAARQLGVSRRTLYRWLRQADPTTR